MSRSIARSGELSISYTVEGHGPETVLLVMGLGGRATDWGERFPAALAERYRVVRFDNRGAGGSAKPDHAWSLEDMARDALAVLDAVHARRAHVIGVSMGGMIAQLLALDHADRVAKLVLMSTSFGGPTIAPPTPAALALFQPARGTTAEEIMRRSLQVLAAPGFAAMNPDAVEKLVENAVREPTPRRAFGAQLQALLASDRAERVAHIAAPTMVVHGDHDALIPLQNGVHLAERIPGARLEILPDCGHFPMWEAPDALVQLVLGFLSEG